MKKGDAISFVDGMGGYYNGLLEQADPKRCIIAIHEKIFPYGKRNYRLHVAMAPTKNMDRYEWFLEKATEIGIN